MCRPGKEHVSNKQLQGGYKNRLASSLIVAGLLGLLTRKRMPLPSFQHKTTCPLFQIKIFLWTMFEEYTVFYVLLCAEVFHLLETAKGTDNPRQFSIYRQP